MAKALLLALLVGLSLAGVAGCQSRDATMTAAPPPKPGAKPLHRMAGTMATPARMGLQRPKSGAGSMK